MVDKKQLTERELTLDRIFDELGPVGFYAEMISKFGLQRTVQLTGYACLWGIAGVESVSDLRKKMEAQGLTKTAAYEAMSDFREFGDFMYAKYHLTARPSTAVVMEKIRGLSASV
jgi:hypothetical protein